VRRFPQPRPLTKKGFRGIIKTVESEGVFALISATQARASARQIIRENKSFLLRVYAAYFGITVGLMIVSSAFSASPSLSVLWSIGITFLSVPLVLGVLHVNNMLYYRRSCSVGNLFDFFRNYSVSIKVIGVSYIFMVGMMIVLIPVILIALIPLIGVFATGWNSMDAAIWPGLVFYVVLILLIAAFLEMLVSSIEMSGYYIALRNRSISFGELLMSALRIGFKYLWKYFVLQLTFLGWSLLAGLPLGIAGGIGIILFTSGSWVPAYMLLLVGALLTLAGVTAVNVYINMASTVFFNTAIDEYEGQTPNPVPPLNGEPPKGEYPGGGPSEFYVREVPPQDAGHSSPQDGEPVEHVDAEMISRGTLCTVVILDGGLMELSVARVLTQVTNLDITEAMAFLSQTPKTLCDGVSEEEARRIAKLLTDAGARVEIR